MLDWEREHWATEMRYWARFGHPVGPACEYEGCDREAEQYGMCYPYGLPVWFYCEEHAAMLGWCPCCGRFFGGVEADAWRIATEGMCYECASELEAELDEYEYGDEEYDYD